MGIWGLNFQEKTIIIEHHNVSFMHPKHMFWQKIIKKVHKYAQFFLIQMYPKF